MTGAAFRGGAGAAGGAHRALQRVGSQGAVPRGRDGAPARARRDASHARSGAPAASAGTRLCCRARCHPLHLHRRAGCRRQELGARAGRRGVMQLHLPRAPRPPHARHCHTLRIPSPRTPLAMPPPRRGPCWCCGDTVHWLWCACVAACRLGRCLDGCVCSCVHQRSCMRVACACIRCALSLGSRHLPEGCSSSQGARGGDQTADLWELRGTCFAGAGAGSGCGRERARRFMRSDTGTANVPLDENHGACTTF
jgi:hypothetical protein